MKLKEHLQISRRAIKMLLHLSRSYTIYLMAAAFLSALMPYIPIWFSAELVDSLYSGAPISRIVLYAALTVGLTFLSGILLAYINARKGISQDALYRSEEWMYSEKTMQMAYASLEDRDTSLLRDRILNESRTGMNLYFLTGCVDHIISHGTTVVLAVGTCATLFASDALHLYAKLGFVSLALFAMGFDIVCTSKSQKINNEVWDRIAGSNLMLSAYTGLVGNYGFGMDIRLYRMGDSVIRSVAAHDNALHRIAVRSSFRQMLVSTPRQLTRQLLRLATYLLLIIAALSGGITVGAIAKYVSCVMLLVDHASNLIRTVQLSFNNHHFLARYFSYFDISNPMYQGSLTVEKRDDNEYYVEFRNVSFKYSGADTYALKNVNLKFKVGEKLAVVGINGSGKTTFIKLMCRLYDPTEGEILLNGVNIKKYDYDEYMSIFSVVFQDFRLFAFTLGQNVAANTTYDEARVLRCLHEAGIDKDKSVFPNGTETYLYKDFDKKGIEVSGGEAQKIALARALYKDAPFIILDEPTAALDPISEYEIYSRFNRISGDKTAIYISHRLASCRFCDKIAVFDNGGIVQIGSHEELLANENGKYSELWHAQAQYYTE